MGILVPLRGQLERRLDPHFLGGIFPSESPLDVLIGVCYLSSRRHRMLDLLKKGFTYGGLPEYNTDYYVCNSDISEWLYAEIQSEKRGIRKILSTQMNINGELFDVFPLDEEGYFSVCEGMPKGNHTLMILDPASLFVRNASSMSLTDFKVMASKLKEKYPNLVFPFYPCPVGKEKGDDFAERLKRSVKEVRSIPVLGSNCSKITYDFISGTKLRDDTFSFRVKEALSGLFPPIEVDGIIQSFEKRIAYFLNQIRGFRIRDSISFSLFSPDRVSLEEWREIPSQNLSYYSTDEAKAVVASRRMIPKSDLEHIEELKDKYPIESTMCAYLCGNPFPKESEFKVMTESPYQYDYASLKMAGLSINPIELDLSLSFAPYSPEYYTALFEMITDREEYDTTLKEAVGRGYVVLIPSVNESMQNATAGSGYIQEGLLMTSSLTPEFADKVVSLRGDGYLSVDDFRDRVKPSADELSELERIGALTCFDSPSMKRRTVNYNLALKE